MPPDFPSTPIDPALLAAFRQQGAAVVAHERGLTAACRIKLAGIARSLGIADDQIEEAIRGLAAAEPSAPPNVQAEKLRRRLRKDLAGKSKTIIGPTIEAQILAAAHRKYGLDAGLSGQVLGEVAAELGLTRITASDATANLAAQIDQAAGDSAWMAREAWDRLRSAGAKWGLDLEIVDEMIEERLAANRADYLRRNSATHATLYIAGGAVLSAAVIIAGLFLSRSMREEAAPYRPELVRSPATSDRAVPPTPAWWDVELSVEMAHARGQLKELSGVCDLMRSSRAEERATGYERLLDQVRAAPDNAELLSAAARFVAGCHALDPDESAAARLRAALIGLLPAAEAPLPATAAHWSIPFWAANTAVVSLDRRGSTSERVSLLADALSAALGAAVDAEMPRPERQRLVRERTAAAAYRQLAAAAGKEPAHVARLYPSLAQRAAAVLSEEERLQADTALLVSALPSAGHEWNVYERSLVRCISSPDPIYALRLIDALRRATDSELVQHLSQLLIVRAGARPKSEKKRDVILAVRQALGGSAGVTSADRWAALEDEANAALGAKSPSDDRRLLEQAVTLAHLTTLAVALAQGEAGFATFDAGIAQPPTLAVATRDARPQSDRSSSKPGSRPLTKSQQRDLGRLIELLGHHSGGGAQAQRESALRGIVALTAETADISPQQAAPIATYLLAEKNIDEHEKVVATLDELRRWNRLRLAVADAIATTILASGQTLDVVRALAGIELPAGQSSDELRRLLLRQVLEDLQRSSAESSAIADGGLLDRAELLITESYRQRAALLGAAPASLAGARSPAQVLEQCAAALAAGLRGAVSNNSVASKLPYELRAARYVADGGLRHTVAVQRLLIGLTANRIAHDRPQQAGGARQLAAESMDASAAAKSALVQLCDHEAALLQLWMKYAPEA